MMQIQKCVKPEIKGLSIIGRFRNRNKWYKKTETARKRKSPVRLAGVRKIGPQIARAHVGCETLAYFEGAACKAASSMHIKITKTQCTACTCSKRSYSS